jgi:hypothetical protein
LCGGSADGGAQHQWSLELSGSGHEGSGSRAFMRSETALCVVMKPMDGASMT